MNKEDEMIREALQLDVNVSDEMNARVMNSVKPKKSGSVMKRIATTVALASVVILGTGFIANAATDGKLVKFLKGKSDNETYVYGNGDNIAEERIDKDGVECEKVSFSDGEKVKAEFINPVATDETVYNLYLKINCEDGMEQYTLLSATAYEGQTDEELYYSIKADFLGALAGIQKPEEKKQVIAALKEAADNAEKVAVRDALLDVIRDYENNSRILHFSMSGLFVKEEGMILIYEDITDLPEGPAAIIASPINKEQKSWIFVTSLGKDTFVEPDGKQYSEEYYQELLERNIPIYDLR